MKNARAKIQIRKKNIYGNELIYPANHEADLFVLLLNKRTISPRDIDIMKELGYEIEQVI